VVRVALGVLLGFIAYNVGLGSAATEPNMVAWGALVLAIVALTTALAGAAALLTRVQLDKDWSVAYLAARLFVGWEFLYAGWDKATTNWYDGVPQRTLRRADERPVPVLGLVERGLEPREWSSSAWRCHSASRPASMRCRLTVPCSRSCGWASAGDTPPR
jgi:hypothetical protein